MNPSLAPTPLDVFNCPLDGISLIEASAGTGKTWNICGLYLRMLLEQDLDIQKILVVTFTNAATAELRERIRARILDTLEHLQGRPAPSDIFAPQLIEAVARHSGKTPEQMAQRLEAALSFFDEAAIYTIHGFCQRALADAPLATGSPYGLELIADDGDLRREAVADFWRSHVAGGEIGQGLALFLNEKKDSPDKWSTILKRRQEKPLSRCDWPPDIDSTDLPHDHKLDEAICLTADLWKNHREQVIETVIDGFAVLNKGIYKSDSVNEAAEIWDGALANGTKLPSGFNVESKARLLSSRYLAEKTKTDKKSQAPQHAFFDAAQTLIDIKINIDASLERLRLRLIRNMLAEAGPRLRQKKRARKVMAFDDILFNAWDALCNGQRPTLAATLRKRYPVALIDEFQDTDPLQCAIFMSIYDVVDESGNRGPLFLVSDPKQSIYSFRNADVHAYLHAKARTDRTFTLIENQRSVGGLIKACNALFAANPKCFILPGIEYVEVEEGKKPRPTLIDQSETSATDKPLRLWQLPKEEDGHYLLRANAQERAVTSTAAEISRLLTEGAAGRITIDERKLRAGDIAVLVRSHRQGSMIKQALGQVGVSSVDLSHESIFTSPDAEQLERVLQAVIDPRQQSLRRSPLLAALATELMGFDATGLQALAADENALADQTVRFEKLRADWLKHGFAFMFRRWMEIAGVSRRLLARPDGDRRLTNLLHLGELLHLSSTGNPAPNALLRWLSSERTEAAKGEEAQLRLESDRNLVQIVTIHKSKGLEYGIVFCPFLWDGFNSSNAKDGLLEYHDDQGDGILDFKPGAKDDKTLKEKRRDEAAAETIRLIYVALTRAVHRCYLIAGCYLYQYGKGDPSNTQSTRSLLNWLAAGANSNNYGNWTDAKTSAEDIEKAWLQIAATASPFIQIGEMPAGPGNPLRETRVSADALSVETPPSHIDRGWRIGSFSGLIHNAQHESAASDHDARAIALEPTAVPADLAKEDILLFPRGPSAGECIHAVFEKVDFTDETTWAPVINRALDIHPPRSFERLATTPPVQRQMLHRMLKDVLATELTNGVFLNRVARSRRINELGFDLRSSNVSATLLNRWLKSNGYTIPRLEFDVPPRYLKGFIDLVFETGGRYYLIDWKSNHLGYTQEDYSRKPMLAAMAAHGYHLQCLIYAVALHRYLGQRIPDYDYARHFGGVIYLFVRGVRPDWLGTDGKPAGTLVERPDTATIESLDALLSNTPKEVAA